MFFLRKYKTVVFVAALLVIVLTMIFLNLKYSSDRSFLREIVLEAAAPAQKALNVSLSNVQNAWLRYIALVGIEEENKNLKKKIDELTAMNLSYQESYKEAQRLKKLLAFSDEHNYHFISARVIGREQAALSRTILIDKGFAHGLKAGMPVVAPPGLIGRLVDVSWHASRVLLFIDENSNIDAMVQRNRTQGIISGAGSRGMILKYISKTQDVKEGDVIVSSGMGGVFPKGLLIGQVGHVDRQEASLFIKINVAPYVDLSKLEEILILAPDEIKIK
jgi:rod shape-determining protein MreC